MKRETVILQKEMGYPVADTLIRLLAYIVDLIVLWSVRQIAIIPILTMLGVMNQNIIFDAISIRSIVVAVVFFLYFVLMTYFFGQTLGKMIFGIRVVSSKGYELTFAQVLYRELIGRYITQALLNLPYLMILFNENRMGLHDFIGDTLVVNSKEVEYTVDVETNRKEGLV
ncbi:RDD family protein [Nosocomiicoccus massiliensis]|uniref:RDD family protein n=1 Tax=Nosocomiicoccus massiliensis TaxID=1232430 RepID=UPI0004065F3D|nr:RDD family protein [Nosocomiicoccus massiliensis]